MSIRILYILFTRSELFFSSFPQQYFTKLSERTIAYINVDIAVFGKKLLVYSAENLHGYSGSNTM